ncbi:MAG: DUF881 domain-containing protein [Armatimonadetes bacterium]|nr:DUF881 domain-containing protein [Armatimonadota bacterium]
MAVSTVDKTSIKRRFAVRVGDFAWISQVTLLAVLLGVLVGLSLNTQRQIRRMDLPPSRFSTSAALTYNLSQRNQELQQENRRLQGRVAHYEEQLATGSQASASLLRSLQEATVLAGLKPMKGRGLVVTLRDSPYLRGGSRNLPGGVEPIRLMIHDDDLIYFLNELKAAGAEAIAVAGADTTEPQRIITRSAVRCVGPVVHVNDIPLAGPYHIYAIGNPKNLRAALEMPEGIIKAGGLDTLGMVQIEERAEMTVPAYAGELRLREAQPVDESP